MLIYNPFPVIPQSHFTPLSFSLPPPGGAGAHRRTSHSVREAGQTGETLRRPH